MKKKPSISRTFLNNMLIVTFISIGILTGLWTWEQYVDFRRGSNDIREMMLNSYRNLLETQVKRSVEYIEYKKSRTEQSLKDTIQERIQEAHDTASHLYEYWKSTKSDDEIQSLIIESLRPIRFNQGRGYFFILDLNGVNRLWADRPELEGKNLLDDPESLDAGVARNLIEIAEKDSEGFFQYNWPKPGIEEGVFPKIAFIKVFEPYGWIIGTGEYLDDFQSQVKEELLGYLGSIRFGRDGYVFVAQWDGLALTDPSKGQNMLGVTDPNGVKIVQELIDLSKADGGFLEYIMPKFEGMKPDPKLSYVEGIKDWQWYVGAGVYIDDIEKAIGTMRSDLTREIRSSLMLISGILIGLLLFAYYYAQRTSRKARMNFRLFASFFEKGARESAFIDPGEMTYEEVENLAHAANQMIEARKQAQENLEESKNWLQSILESIQAGVIVVDPETHKILELNRAAAEMIGVPKEKLIQTICYRHMCPSEMGKCPITDLDQVIEQSDRELLRADGTTVPILKTVNCATIHGKKYLIESFLDLSEKKRLESMLRQAQKMESIGTLTSGIAHDFNNILHIIIGNVDMALLDIPEGIQGHVNLMEIKSASHRASSIVRQLLDFSRKTDQEFKPIDAVSTVKEALKLLRSTIPSSIEMRLHAPDSEATILADSTQINQVLMNICTNAFHAMEEAGGILEVTLEIEAIESGRLPDIKLPAGEYVKIMIEDTGPGIDPENLNRIFDPYFTTKPIGKGVGMGLAVVLGIIKNHHGDIFVTSRPGKGTTFTVFLPVVYEKPAEVKKAIGEKPIGKEKILFVDDEDAIVKVTGMLLTGFGYTVTGMKNPVDALALFRENPGQFDMVIADMTMPQLSGLKLSEAIREVRLDIPIIICTGYSSVVDEQKARKIGIDDYVMKPLKGSELAQTIRNVLDRKKMG